MERKLAELISANTEGGIIYRPFRFWEEAGYRNINTGRSKVDLFCKKGLLAYVKECTYRVLFSLAPDGRAVVLGGKGAKEAKAAPDIPPPERCPFLILLPEEKMVFDALAETKLQAYDRLRENDFPFSKLGLDDRDTFFDKMIRCGIMNLVGKAKRGRIFHLDIERQRSVSSNVRVMADVNLILDNLKRQREAVDSVLSVIEEKKEQLDMALKDEEAKEAKLRTGLSDVVKKLQESQEKVQKRIAIFEFLADLNDSAKIEIMDLLTLPRK